MTENPTPTVRERARDEIGEIVGDILFAKNEEDQQDAYKELEKTVNSIITQAQEEGFKEATKAFGGCTNCYGKGYHTTKEALSGRGYYKQLCPYNACDKCDRGKQFGQVVDYFSSVK